MARTLGVPDWSALARRNYTESSSVCVCARITLLLLKTMPLMVAVVMIVVLTLPKEGGVEAGCSPRLRTF